MPPIRILLTVVLASLLTACTGPRAKAPAAPAKPAAPAAKAAPAQPAPAAGPLASGKPEIRYYEISAA